MTQPNDPGLAARPAIALLSLGSMLHVGGIERYLLQLVEHLGDEYRFYILGNVSPTFEAEAQALGRDATVMHVPRYSKFDVRAVWRMARLFRRLGVALVHTVEPRSRLIGHLAARLVGLRAVQTFEITALSYDSGALKRRVYEQIEKVYNRYVSHHLIFVSDADRTLYARRGLLNPGRVSVIYNAVDLRDVAPLLAERERWRAERRARLGLPASAVVACTVARLDEQKGLDYLVEAAARLKAGGRLGDLHFVIVGDGPDRAQLEAAIETHGLAGRVCILGFLPKGEVYRTLAASDLFVLPSRYESFPFSIVEAVAMELPCVVTDVGGNAEVVADGQHGYVVPRGDAAALADAVARLGVDEALRRQLGRAARQQAGRFAVETMIRETDDVYRALLLA